jgi:hypothetical protein
MKIKIIIAACAISFSSGLYSDSDCQSKQNKPHQMSNTHSSLDNGHCVQIIDQEVGSVDGDCTTRHEVWGKLCESATETFQGFRVQWDITDSDLGCNDPDMTLDIYENYGPPYTLVTTKMVKCPDDNNNNNGD